MKLNIKFNPFSNKKHEPRDHTAYGLRLSANLLDAHAENRKELEEKVIYRSTSAIILGIGCLVGYTVGTYIVSAEKHFTPVSIGLISIAALGAISDIFGFTVLSKKTTKLKICAQQRQALANERERAYVGIQAIRNEAYQNLKPETRSFDKNLKDSRSDIFDQVTEAPTVSSMNFMIHPQMN